MTKPVYRVSTMKEIAAIPWNGLKVISTFSGCGGSCLGYRMAGFKVVWANEFVPAAQESYRANAPDCILDGRDIKVIQPEEIHKATGLKKRELDLFDGSPPCQAFSSAGKREKGWGKDKSYEHGAKQKNETLFDEYIRLLRGLMPKVFIAENVSGLVKGVAKGFFLEILAALKASGYRVACRLLDAQWLGVPQMRQRVIFMGIRSDLKLDPIFPKPLPYRYSVRDALPWIDKAVQDPSGQFGIQEASDRPCFTIKAGSASHCKVYHESGGFSRTETSDKPSPAITATQCRMTVEQPASKRDRKVLSTSASPTVLASNTGFSDLSIHQRKFTIDELKRICAFPDDFILTGSYSQQWERLGNSVPPVMMFHIAKTIQDQIFSASLKSSRKNKVRLGIPGK